MRKVSLNRLEKAIVDHQGQITDTMRYLAGLLRVRYVFFYPDSNDIVIAGPAEGWMDDSPAGWWGSPPAGRSCSCKTWWWPCGLSRRGKPGAAMIGCSIDPTPEGLAADAGIPPQHVHSAGQERRWPSTMTPKLPAPGLCRWSRVIGVSPKTHFAEVLVEADYRMKLIGIGLEKPPVKMVSFVDRVNPAQVSSNALFRWYFVPDYQCVRVTEDNLAMELVGDGVKLVGEDEVVGAAASGSSAGRGTSPARPSC